MMHLSFCRIITAVEGTEIILSPGHISVKQKQFSPTFEG